MSAQPLKRSHKTDFTNNGMGGGANAAAMMVARERSFVRPNRDPTKRRSQTMATMKGNKQPTLEIYRPPNVRSDCNPINNNNNAAGKLNVHAKEFTMNQQQQQQAHQLQSSKSSGNLNLVAAFEPMAAASSNLQHSKSSGNILRHINAGMPIIPVLPYPLMHSTSSSTQIYNNYNNRQSFHQFVPAQEMVPVFSGQNQNYYFMNNQQNFNNNNNNVNQNLKRSKSLGAADSKNLAAKLKSIAKEDLDISMFGKEDQNNLKVAIDDPNQLPSRTLMDLVKIVMEKAVEGIRYSEGIAKLCIAIIEGEKNQTFLESLLNTCQQWYQERDKILRGIKAGDGTRFTAFMWFLTEMCSQLKRHQLKEEFEALQPELVLLSVLAKCCQACVSLPIKCLSETECLFFVLTSIGRDLETVLPEQLEQLLASVRDGFLASAGSPSVRRTLLQLIELHASNWQLPGSSVLYYYPRIK